MLINGLYWVAALGGVIVALTLWAWGQPPICTCGYVKLWEGFIWSSGNSQHVADWYTLSHIVHGMLIILLGRLANGRLSFPAMLIIAILTGMAWEVVEHTDWVLGKFRDVTVYQGYVGDSILNSVMDYVWMWVGFFAAHAISTASVIGLIIAMEVSAAIFGRDCLTFTTLQILYPIDIIGEYQQAINPTRRP